jgi:predicted O-methyltransferase YrrM
LSFDPATSPVPSSAHSWRRDLPGMSFSKFNERYGASCRTKNLAVLPASVSGRIGFAARLVLGRLPKTNGRFYSPPAHSRLPFEFIRLDPWEAEYLFLLAQTAEAGIVEIGRFHGGSTFLMSCANRQVPIWSIDLAPQNDDRLRQLLTENKVGENVELVVGDSHHGDFPQIGQYDLLFIDGDHSYGGCRSDLEKFFPALADGGHLLLHDCVAENEVQQAVLDFLAQHDTTIVRSPYIINSYWQTPYGSLAHFLKTRH